MTTRSLFNIILKIIGIFFIKDILAVITTMLSVFLYYAKQETFEEGLWVLALNLLLVLIYLLVSYYFIFKSDLIIDKLKLGEGTHLEEIPINIHRSTILSISIIVIGGLYVADEIPNFCRQLFIYYQDSHLAGGGSKQPISFSIFSGIKIIIGLLLLGNNRQIVNYIEYKRSR